MSGTLQIHIPTPCHENWHAMTPDEQGRFCGSCRKVVVDFSAMSDKELLAYISNVSGYTACGRFSNEQLNRNIQVGERKMRLSWAYVWNIIITTFLITEANAQVCPKKKRAIVPSVVNKSDIVNTAISTIGYKAEAPKIDIIEVDKPIVVFFPLLASKMRVGGFVVTEKTPIQERVNRALDSCIGILYKKDVVVYPNPVVRGNIAQVKLALPNGDYRLEVVSTSGQLMLALPLYIQSKEQQIGLPTQESWNAGAYWIRVSSAKSKKIYQGKMLLQ